MAQRQIIVIAHNLRSTHNVGALLRTCDGLGADMVYLTGHTPYPGTMNDTRLPFIVSKMNRKIHKTALGAESSVRWEHRASIDPLIRNLQNKGFTVCALEQSPKSIKLHQYKPPDKIAFILGREVVGLESSILGMCNEIIEIPMFGSKESYNVVEAASMAMFHFRFYGQP